jgi:predicted O-methyltransferase YrrM
VSLSFCPELEELYRLGHAVGQTGKVFDNVSALSTPNNLRTLRALMMERRPLQTLEVGLAFGGSAMTMAVSHRDLQQPPARQHTALDPHQRQHWDNCAVQALERAGLIGYVDVREQPSAIALAELVGRRATFDLIYVDGSHLFDDVFVDAYFGFRLLSDTGLILFDDCTIDHVSKVLKFVTTNWQGWTDEVDLSPYRPDGQSVRYKIGRQLGKTQLRAFRRTATPSRPWDTALHDF